MAQELPIASPLEHAPARQTARRTKMRLPLEGAGWADFAIWATYFAGQALIAWGVASKLDSQPSRV